MSLRENRPPRTTVRPTLTKKSSLISLRDVKSKPIAVSSDKPLVKTTGSKAALRPRTIRSSPRSTVRPILTPGKKIGLRQPAFNPKVAAATAREEVMQDAAKAVKALKATAQRNTLSSLGHGHPLPSTDLADFKETSLSHLLNKAGIAPPIPPKSSRRSLVSTYTTISDDDKSEDLEEKIRNALTPPDIPRRTQIRETPSSIKSVRWDPAIISYGSIKSSTTTRPPSPDHTSPCPRSRIDFANALQTISQLKKKDQRAVCRLLASLDSTESDDESTASSTVQGEDSSKESVIENKIAKKLNPEAPIFRDFSFLKNNVVQNKAVVEEEASEKVAQKIISQPPIVVSTPKELPKRPIQLRIVTSTPQNQRRDPKEPTWVNIFNPPAPEDMPQGFRAFPITTPKSKETRQAASTPDFQPVQHPVQPPMPPMFPFNPFPIGLPNFPDSVWVQVPMHILQNPYGLPPMVPPPPPGPWNNANFEHPSQAPRVSRVPQAPRAPHPAAQSTPLNPPKVRRPPVKPRILRGPLIDVSSSFIPPEDGSCRVTHADNLDEAWRQSLLDKFIAKYPQTGTASDKAKAQVPGYMPQAAAIQQHLELLIYQERERSAFDGGVHKKGKDNGKLAKNGRKFSPNGLVDIAPVVEQVSGGNKTAPV